MKRMVNSILHNPVHFWIMAAVLFCLARLATWGYPYDSDHWIFYYIGKDWFEGGMLYVTAWDHKPPMIFLFNGLMHLFTGDNIILHRVWLTAISAFTVVLFYKLAHKIVPGLSLAVFKHKDAARDNRLAKISVLVFTFLTSLSQFSSSGNNTENYGLLFLVAMWLCYYRYVESKRVRSLVLAGACLSVLFFLKGTFLLFGIPIAILLLLSYRKSFSELARLLLAFGLPVLVHAGFWLWYFGHQGLLQEFWVASFGFSAKYATSAWRGTVSNEPLLAVITFAMLIPAAFSFGFLLARANRPHAVSRSYLAVVLSFAVSLVIVLSVGSFYPYYLQVIMPFMAIGLVHAVTLLMRSKGATKYVVAGMAALLLIGFYGVSTKQLLNNYTGTARESARENKEVAAYITERTSPQDKIFDNEYGATMYQLAGRKSGSRYVSASVLLLDYRDKYGYNLGDTFMKDMDASRAAYIVKTKDKSIYDADKPVAEYIAKNYHVEKSFETIEVLRRN